MAKLKLKITFKHIEMSGSECNKPVQTQFLLELRMSILRRRCSFGVFIARCWFPVDNTDMLRWSCRRRGWRGEYMCVSVCECVCVCVCVIEEPVYFQFRWRFKCHVHSPSKEIVVLHSVCSVFFFIFSPLLFILAAISWLVRHLTSPTTSSVFTFSRGVW